MFTATGRGGGGAGRGRGSHAALAGRPAAPGERETNTEKKEGDPWPGGARGNGNRGEERRRNYGSNQVVQAPWAAPGAWRAMAGAAQTGGSTSGLHRFSFPYIQPLLA